MHRAGLIVDPSRASELVYIISSDFDSHYFAGGALAGLVVVSLIACILAVTAAFFFVKWKNKGKSPPKIGINSLQDNYCKS